MKGGGTPVKVLVTIEVNFKLLQAGETACLQTLY
jgi:hypothetical protein